LRAGSALPPEVPVLRPGIGDVHDADESSTYGHPMI